MSSATSSLKGCSFSYSSSGGTASSGSRVPMIQGAASTAVSHADSSAGWASRRDVDGPSDDSEGSAGGPIESR
jgi:hypothetical protein